MKPKILCPYCGKPQDISPTKLKSGYYKVGHIECVDEYFAERSTISGVGKAQTLPGVIIERWSHRLDEATRMALRKPLSKSTTDIGRLMQITSAFEVPFNVADGLNEFEMFHNWFEHFRSLDLPVLCLQNAYSLYLYKERRCHSSHK